MRKLAKRLCPFVPYAAVAVGMYGVHSAWAALGLYHAGALAAVVALGPADLGARKRPYRLAWTPLAAVAFALGGVAIYVLWPFLNSQGRPIAERLADYGVTRHAWPWIAIYFCVVNSVVEEFFWRGCLWTESRRVAENDMLFGGYHVPVMLAFVEPVWAIPVFVSCALAGWAWRMLRAVSGGLAVPVITHVIADSAIVIAVHFRVFC